MTICLIRGLRCGPSKMVDLGQFPITLALYLSPPLLRNSRYNTLNYVYSIEESNLIRGIL